MKKFLILAVDVLGIRRIATICDHAAVEGGKGGRARHDAHPRFRGKVSV
jgi:hypothetical protein